MFKLSFYIVVFFFLLILSLRGAIYFFDLILASSWWSYFIIRLVIFLPLVAGAISLYKKQKYIASRVPISPEIIKAKVLGLRLGLIALLLYSAILNTLVSNFPVIDFIVDYGVLLPLLLLLCPWYVNWVEGRRPKLNDGYFLLGDVVSGNRAWCWADQKPFFLMWAVKLSFIPLMYSWLLNVVVLIISKQWVLDPKTVMLAIVQVGISADLLMGTAGYLFASRIFGTEVKSTDSTFSGWLSCMICYPPFMALLSFFQQKKALVSADLIIPNTALYWFWVLLTILVWIVYCLATFSFGYRFSNLSYRGLVSDGCYRYTKHPAYLSKNIYWWLCALPFIFNLSLGDALIVGLLMAYTSFIYYMRAKTEENHLMQYPEYVAYAESIKKNGVFSKISAIYSR